MPQAPFWVLGSGESCADGEQGLNLWKMPDYVDRLVSSSLPVNQVDSSVYTDVKQW